MNRNPLLPDRKRPLLFAHRGASSLAPENTLASFRRARECGAPGIELDVHVCATGELVVAHDDTFRRSAPGADTGEKKIEELPWDRIREIDVGSFFSPEFSGERCSLLEDVLEEFAPELYVDIELKTRAVSGDALPGKVEELLSRMRPEIAASVTVSSFNPFALRTFRAAARRRQGTQKTGTGAIPLAVIYCLSDEIPWILRRGAGRFIAGADYVKPKSDISTQAHLSRNAKKEGRPVVPWTVDDPGLADDMLRRGAAGIITNRPQNFPAFLSITPPPPRAGAKEKDKTGLRVRQVLRRTL